MKDNESYINPSIYLSNYLNDFEDIITEYDVVKKRIRKGEFLTQYGVINNTAYYIKEGVIHLSLGHENGKKSLCLFGPGTIFPVGVEIHEFRAEYEMIIQAFSDIEVYAMSYTTLKTIVQENGKLAGELLKENCDFIGYMFLDTINQTFEPCLSRICDILYLYLINIQPLQDIVPLSQSELASIAGVSLVQVERIVKKLKNEEIITTSRKQIIILDKNKLLAHCTLSMQSNINEKV